MKSKIAFLIIGIVLGHASAFFLYSVPSESGKEAVADMDVSGVPVREVRYERNAKSSKSSGKVVVSANNPDESTEDLSVAENHGSAVGPVVSDVQAAVEEKDQKRPEPRKISKELRQWSEAHKTEVGEVIAKMASESTAESMTQKIYEGSQFLSEMEETLDQSSNEFWAYQAKAELETLIYSHPLAHDVEIVSLSCKQLMCELIAVVNNLDSWFQIDFHIRNNVRRINNELPALNLFHRDPESSASYYYNIYRYNE